MSTENPEDNESSPLLEELTENQLCQIDGEDPPFPPFETFSGSDRAHDKTRLIKWLTYHPEGVPVARTTKALFPSCGTKKISDREYDHTDYRFVLRFFDRSEYVSLDRDADLIRAFPQPEAFHLTRESKIPSSHRPGYAKDRAEACTYGFWSLNDVKDARLLAKDFTTYLESIHDRRLMLEAEGRDDLKLTMPYHTRFNNEHRKKEQWARYNTAWEQADDRYQRGVMITLTTDPKRYDSIGAMVDGLMDAWQDLHETLNHRYLDDQRLDFIRALEFGGSDKSNHVGLPHLHVCVFGVPYVDHAWLKNYWADRHGEIVHIHGMNKRGSESWVMSTGQHSGKSAAGYLGKYLSKAFESIGDRPDDLRNELESWTEGGDWQNAQLWKLALYWATGRQFWDCSHDLKDDYANIDRLEEVPGLGETKLDRLEEHGIRTLSDVRLSQTEDIAAIDGISAEFAQKLKDIVGDPSDFDIYNFEFIGAATYENMPADWSADAKHFGIPAIG